MDNYFFNPYAVPTFLSSGAFLVISLYRVVRDRFSFLSSLLFLIGLIVSVWLFAFSWMYSATNEKAALWWAKAAYIALPFLPAAILNFALVFLQTALQNKALVRFCWAASMLFSLLAVETDLVISGVKHYKWGYYPQYDVFSVPYLLFFFGVLALCAYEYFSEYKKTKSGTAQHKRLRSFMIAFVVASVAIVDYFAKFGLAVYPFGYIPFLGFLLLSSTTISRYRLVDITPAFAADRIMDTMNDILFVTDPEGTIRLVNKAAEVFWGKSRNDLVGKDITQVVGNAFLSNQFASLIESEPITNFEISCCAKKDLSLSISAIKDKTGEVLAVVVIAKDITYLKRVERDFIKERKEKI